MDMMRPKVTVCVPVYNSEMYIERCVRSLLEQTLKDVEFIFVNDCSTDSSLSKLKEVVSQYPQRGGRISIIDLPENHGLAYVRNLGLKHANGEYVIHCDSDDWVEIDMYETLYEEAISTHADIVVCDILHEYHDRRDVSKFNEKSRAEFLNQNKWWTVWCRLIKREFLEQHALTFWDGIDMWEDVNFSMRAHFYAERVSFVHIPLYHYNRANINSMLSCKVPQLVSKKLEQWRKCISLLEDFFQQSDIYPSSFFKRSKLRVVEHYIDTGRINEVAGLYPEIATYILGVKRYSFIYRCLLALVMLGWPFLFEKYVRLR